MYISNNGKYSEFFDLKVKIVCGWAQELKKLLNNLEYSEVNYTHPAWEFENSLDIRNVGIRQIKYLNNIIEQDHRSKKRIINPMLGFQSFQSANKTLKGIEAMNMIKKGQVKNLNYSVLNETKYINQLFGIVI